MSDRISWVQIVTEEGHTYYVDNYAPGKWRLYIFGEYHDFEDMDTLIEYIDTHRIDQN